MLRLKRKESNDMSTDRLISVKERVCLLIESLTNDINKIINETSDSNYAIEKILQKVSNELNEKTSGYLGDIYTALKSITLEEEFFKDVTHSNAFYSLGLRHKIMDTYMFEVKDLNAFGNEMGFKEIKNTFYDKIVLGFGASAATFGLGSLLLAALKKQTAVPFILLIAGSIAVGLTSYYGGTRYLNKRKLSTAVNSYMKYLKAELIKWINGIEKYYDSQIDKLKKSLEVDKNG